MHRYAMLGSWITWPFFTVPDLLAFLSHSYERELLTVRLADLQDAKEMLWNASGSHRVTIVGCKREIVMQPCYSARLFKCLWQIFSPRISLDLKTSHFTHETQLNSPPPFPRQLTMKRNPPVELYRKAAAAPEEKTAAFPRLCHLLWLVQP